MDRDQVVTAAIGITTRREVMLIGHVEESDLRAEVLDGWLSQ